jgi:predicted nucleotidyltransferase
VTRCRRSASGITSRGWLCLAVLRDDFGPDSDVDVLVEFQAGHVPGFNFVSIERELSGLLQGRRVNMVTPKFLNPRIRDQVLSSAEPLYVAA